MRGPGEWRLGVCDQWSRPSLMAPEHARTGALKLARHWLEAWEKEGVASREVLELQHRNGSRWQAMEIALSSSTQLINSPTGRVT